MLVQSPASNTLSNYLQEYSLMMVPSGPTHHTMWMHPPVHTWLDLFIIRNLDTLIAFKKSDSPFAAGHDFISIKISAKLPVAPARSFTHRRLNNVDPIRLKNTLVSNLLPLRQLSPPLPSFLSVQSEGVVFGPTDFETDSYVGAFTDILLSSYDEISPLVSASVKSRRKPWVSNSITELMRWRDTAYKRAKLTGTADDLAKYRSLRSQVKNALDTAKNSYIAEALAKSTTPAEKWKVINRLNVSATSLPSPTQFFSCDTLNIFFSSILNRHLPLSESDYQSACELHYLSYEKPYFNFCPVSQAEVLRVINQSSSKGSGIDGLTLAMIKQSAPHTLPYITQLVNGSILSATFPATWKKILVSPLAKVRSMLSPSDTRPIAQLSELSKILERIVHSQLSSYLETHCLLDERQTGFRAGHSTQSALIAVTDDVRVAIDKRMVTILILFDFSKAFDSIPHALLLAKLRSFGLSNHALRWFFNYLSGREQAVIDRSNNHASQWLATTSGVPQGSVLGPLLFIMFLNDLPNVLRHSKHMIFADDLQIYLHCYPKDLSQTIANIQHDAQAVADWSTRNGLTLNASKTKVMILGSQAYVSSIDLDTIPKVEVNEMRLSYVSECRNLGVILTQTLDWQPHVRSISRSVHGALYSLRFHRHALSFNIRKSLVESLVFPKFDYGCIVYRDLDGTRELFLQRLQNACLRFVHGNIPFMAHVTPYRIEIGWLSARSRRDYFLGSLAYSIISRQHPPYLARSFILHANNPAIRRSERNQQQLLLYSASRTEALNQSFRIRAAALLNTLPITDFHSLSLARFKTLLREALHVRDREEWEIRALGEGLSSVTVRSARN